jgi:hypothetical protein
MIIKKNTSTQITKKLKYTNIYRYRLAAAIG